MRKAIGLSALLVSAAGYVFLQTAPAPPRLASLMPAGAMLYLEAADFGRLLRDWDASKVKTEWLESDNYAVFSRSNLFSKLEGVYGEYGSAAGFCPGLASLIEIAGAESALALYDIREVEFLYISRVANAQLAQSQLWALRDKFEQRQAGGFTFYLRSDPQFSRTVAFAVAQGYLLVATRDDLIARALSLVAGRREPNVAGQRWYQDAIAAAARPGELRLVMNLDALVDSVHFRSYWIQRNASTLRQYWAGIADVSRSNAGITEKRVLLRTSAPPDSTAGSAAVASLIRLVPPEAGLYKAQTTDSSSATATIVKKLIAADVRAAQDWRYAPQAVSPDVQAGSEADLETRIDEPPLAADTGLAQSVADVRDLLDKTGVQGILELQSSLPSGGAFVRTPSVVILSASSSWDPAAVQTALTSAVKRVWTTSAIGAGFVAGTAGRHAIQRLDGLGTLLFAVRGSLLLLGNDQGLLVSALDRVGTNNAGNPYTYTAGFRHARERANFGRLMTALDYSSSNGEQGYSFTRSANEPPFFWGIWPA